MTAHRLSLLLIFSLLPLVSATPAIAQRGLPDRIISASSLSSDDKQQIDRFVNEQLTLLATGAPADVRKARNELIRPLRTQSPSVAFRLSFTTAAKLQIRTLLRDQNELIVVNALRVAGDMATPESLQLLSEAIVDRRETVRFSAARAYRETFWHLTRTSPALRSEQALAAIRELRSASQKEGKPIVLDGYLLALGEAATIPPSRLEGVRAAALAAIAEDFGSLAKAVAPGTPQEAAIIDVLTRGGQVLRDSLTNASVAQTPLPEQVLREAAGFAGQCMAPAHRRIEISTVSDAERARLATLVGVAESVYFFAHSKLGGNPVNANLRDLVAKGQNREFDRRVREFIGGRSAIINELGSYPADWFMKP